MADERNGSWPTAGVNPSTCTARGSDHRTEGHHVGCADHHGVASGVGFDDEGAVGGSRRSEADHHPIAQLGAHTGADRGRPIPPGSAQGFTACGFVQAISPVHWLIVMPEGSLLREYRYGYEPPMTAARMLYSMPG